MSSAGGWWRSGDRRSGDHYYWLTAFLAAHHMQRRTCRTVAAIIFCFTLTGPILSLGRLGPSTPLGGVTQVATLCGGTAMAMLWLRQGWPSRLTSQACVVLGTVCSAVTCLVIPDPALGVLGTPLYAVLGSFAVVFHSLRLLAFTWTVGVVVLLILAARLAEEDAAMAVAAVLTVVVINVTAVYACRMVVRLFAMGTNLGELEPVTGLLTRDVFYERFAGLIGARSRDDDRRLVVVVVNIDGFSLLAGVRGRVGTDDARVDVARALRETARRDAVIAHPSDAEFWLADLFTNADPHPLAERIRASVAGTSAGLTASIGVVCTPLAPLTAAPAYDAAEELLSIAVTAMYEARRSGGNQTREAIDPALGVLSEPATGD